MLLKIEFHWINHKNASNITWDQALLHFSMSSEALRDKPVSKVSWHELRAFPDLPLFPKSELFRVTH